MQSMRRCGLFLIGLTALLGFSSVAYQAGIVVASLADSGDGSLRAAIENASDGSTITIVAEGTIILESTLEIEKSLSISGRGPDVTSISGNNSVRVFHIHPRHKVVLTAMKITGGASVFGAGIYNEEGEVVINSSVISGNVADSRAAGIFNTCEITLNRTRVLANESAHFEGAIFNFGTFTANDSRISNNRAGSLVGGIANEGVMEINRSAITDNRAEDGSAGLSNSGTLTIVESAIERNTTLGPAGGIANFGAVNMQGSAVRDNVASSGAGISNQGSLEIVGSAISGNLAENTSGGIENFSTLRVVASRIAMNMAQSYGGILNDGGIVEIIGGEISNNIVEENGGAIGVLADGQMTIADADIFGNEATEGAVLYNDATTIIRSSALFDNKAGAKGGAISNRGSLELSNCTFSGNIASENGSAIFSESSGSIEVSSCTFAHNMLVDSEGAVLANFGQMQVQNTILSNEEHLNCGGNITSLGHNIDSGSSCGFASSGDQSDTDPMLGELADNGGPSLTLALSPGSPAIDRGDDQACPDRDQRGVDRPQGAACDIGAFELEQ